MSGGFPSSHEPVESFAHASEETVRDRGGLFVKRCLDVAISAAALLMLSPVLCGIAAMIVLDSGRPVFFRQMRHGFGRLPFRMWKFRTLTREASQEAFRQVTLGDARMTRFGRIMRRSNLDELPQLLNVLGGSMSLVGPRPHPIALDDQFEPLIPNYARRYDAKPGITGWAQVNGCRGETDTIGKMEERIACDLYYIANRSLLLDLRILELTDDSDRS
mgnify:CR=1 FL=1